MTFIFKGLALCLGGLLAMSAHAHPGHKHQAHSHGQHGHAAHPSPEFPDPASVAAPTGISVTGCWIRALPARLPAAGYLRLHNSGEHDAVLVGARSEGFGKVMLHTHEEANGMAAMVHVDKVVVPAGGSFDFAPRGHHVMLEQAAVDLEVGGQHPLTLWFEGDQALTVQCDVRPPATLQ